jgi:NTE family protein
MSGSNFGQRNEAILAGEAAVARLYGDLQRKLAERRAGVAATA